MMAIILTIIHYLKIINDQKHNLISNSKNLNLSILMTCITLKLDRKLALHAYHVYTNTMTTEVQRTSCTTPNTIIHCAARIPNHAGMLQTVVNMSGPIFSHGKV